ncbi:autoinducer binding domain-containing protein [Bradyrhizobium elkanii]|uniref:autoinducer binding domain-containing protein n=1 Tax=Bradyrhizobium elkanii TaxID=29448 RepID=UPI003512D4E8
MQSKTPPGFRRCDPDRKQRGVATRLSQRLGFQRFAYLRLTGETPMLISPHPKSRTNRYFQLGYQQPDPVVRCARLGYGLFGWGGESSSPPGEREQRRFFGEATTFSFQPLWDWITEAEPDLFN